MDRPPVRAADGVVESLQLDLISMAREAGIE
jgi:hypothetical protein